MFTGSKNVICRTDFTGQREVEVCLHYFSCSPFSHVNRQCFVFSWGKERIGLAGSFYWHFHFLNKTLSRLSAKLVSARFSNCIALAIKHLQLYQVSLSFRIRRALYSGYLCLRDTIQIHQHSTVAVDHDFKLTSLLRVRSCTELNN